MRSVTNIERLGARHRRLVVLYVAFVFLFGSSCAMAASGVAHSAVLPAFAASAVVALPLYVFVVLVHSATRAIKPNAGTSGLKQLIASIVCLTPIEAALVLPAINLYVSRKVLVAEAVGTGARSAKGSVQFPLDNTTPEALVVRMVKFSLSRLHK